MENLLSLFESSASGKEHAFPLDTSYTEAGDIVWAPTGEAFIFAMAKHYHGKYLCPLQTVHSRS